jgi:hypothetical protein
MYSSSFDTFISSSHYEEPPGAYSFAYEEISILGSCEWWKTIGYIFS